MSTRDKVDLEEMTNPGVRRERQQRARHETPVHVVTKTRYPPHITACDEEVVDGMHVTGNPPDRKQLKAEKLTLCPKCDKALAA